MILEVCELMVGVIVCVCIMFEFCEGFVVFLGKCKLYWIFFE